MHPWKRALLDGEWELAIVPNDEYCSNPFEIRNYADFQQCSHLKIKSTVPGNFELDMQKAGLLPDPYFGLNTLELQKLENRHLWYARTFLYEDDLSSGTAFLCFEGIDTFSEIFLNGKSIAKTGNMLISHEVRADGLRQGLNDLVVHIRPASIEARSLEITPSSFAMKYNGASLKVRKAAHMFGWDIMPRILSGGIWRSVYIFQKPKARIDDVFMYTTRIDTLRRHASAEVFFHITAEKDQLKGYRIVVSGECGDSRFRAEQDLWHNYGKIGIYIADPKLWWPAGSGRADLYDTKVELFFKDERLDVYTLEYGVRTVELLRTSLTDKSGSGEFCFRINGAKIFVKGTNWVPADAFHSRDKDRLPVMLGLLKDIGCNAVRCWGGNVYEDHDFFDFCDRNGIIVWQDFAMGCAIYPQDPDFQSVMADEVRQIVTKLRNHPSLVLWAGDNECDCAYAYWDAIPRDPNQNVITRRLIPEVLRLYDHTRPYLPSSPYLDETAYAKHDRTTPEDHLWGPRDYFKSSFYTTSVAHFASEMGYHGCNAPESIRRFISPEKVWPWQDNDEWVAHAASPEIEKSSPFYYRIELMAKQIKELFGRIPDDLNDFALASQISQAEAKKFFIELFRTSKWRRTGIIWWNLIDGWPQFSDAVVDYYFIKKLAYHYIKNSQQDICLMFGEPGNWKIDLYASNDTLQSAAVHYTVTDIADHDRIVLSGDTTILPNSSAIIGSLPYSMGEKHFYQIEWTYDGKKGKNHYLAGTPPFDLDFYKDCMKKAGLLLLEGFE